MPLMATNKIVQNLVKKMYKATITLQKTDEKSSLFADPFIVLV